MANRDLAVVTGAASGVGQQVVRQLLARDCVVIGVDRFWPMDSTLPHLIQVTGSVELSATWTQVAALIGTLPDCELSMLVINAAKLVIGGLLEISDEDFSESINVNVIGAVKALRICLPLMIKSGKGSVVAVASTDAVFAEQDLAAYCTSKGALLQLIRSVAVDYGREGIRANAVCPGAINTPFFRQHVDAAVDPVSFLREKTERHPSGRILQPQDVASAIVYLLSDGAIGISGTHVMIDGGLTATFDYHAKSDSLTHLAGIPSATGT